MSLHNVTMSDTVAQLKDFIAAPPQHARNKVTVVGTGAVGMAAAFSIITQVKRRCSWDFFLILRQFYRMTM